MSESVEGIIVFSILAVAVSIISHVLIKKISSAILVAAISTALVFQLIVFFLAGYLDPSFPVALITTFLLAFLIALIIGVPFKIWRRNTDKDQGLEI
jgi:predicted neutral ceramidase superfamily lipid hydrolase